jgi:hypothetical protein
MDNVRILMVVLIYLRHKPIDNINLLVSWRRRIVFPVRYGQTYRVEMSFKQKTRQFIICSVVVKVLGYKPEGRGFEI